MESCSDGALEVPNHFMVMPITYAHRYATIDIADADHPREVASFATDSSSRSGLRALMAPTCFPQPCSPPMSSAVWCLQPMYVTLLAAPGEAKWAVSTAGGITPRWSHRGDELFYLDPRSNMVATRITTAPSFAVQSTRVLFNASDFIQTAVSRRNFDVAHDDQRFLMVQRADGAKRGQLIVVEHWADEMARKGARD